MWHKQQVGVVCGYRNCLRPCTSLSQTSISHIPESGIDSDPTVPSVELSAEAKVLMILNDLDSIFTETAEDSLRLVYYVFVVLLFVSWLVF